MATGTINTRLEVTGDQEYRDQMKKSTAELVNQKSQLKLLTEEYAKNRNSQEALEKQLEKLRDIQKSSNGVVAAARQGTANATKEQEKYGAEVADCKNRIEEAQAEIERLNTSTHDGAKRQAELTEEIKKYQSQLEETSRNQEMATKGVDDWATKTSRAETALNKTNTQISKYEKYLAEAKESSDKCAKSIDEYGKAVKEAGDKQEKFDGKLDSSEAAIGSLSESLAASAINVSFEKITEAIVECTDAAAGFETAFAKLTTIADTSRVSLEQIKEDILALSSETGQGVSELSEASYNAISAGVDTAGAVGFVSTATKLAIGGFTDNTTAVDILTTVLNAYQLELNKVSDVSDYLVTAQNLGKTTVDELASSMGKVIPVAAAYNVEMDNLSSAVAILTANGIETAESVTYLKSALNELGDSGSVVAQMLEEKTGFSFGELAAKGKSLGDVIEILGDAVENDKTAFNDLWSSSEAGVAAISLLSSGSSKYNDVLKQMRDSAGATETAYEKMANTTEMSQKRMENAFNNLKIAVGSELQKQMSKVYEKGTDLTIWATEFVEENEWLIPVLEGVAIAIGGMTVAIALYTVATQVVIPAINSFNAALAANPVGIVVTAIAGLTSVLVPLATSMQETTTEAEKQADAWKKQAEALEATTDAYKEQSEEVQKESDDIRDNADALTSLISKENKTAAEKRAIVELTEKLNESIPDLGLHYDDLSNSINMTNEELNKTLESLEKQQRYEVVQSNYIKTYEENRKAKESLAKAQEALTEATEKYNEEYVKFEKSGETLPSTLGEARDTVNEYTSAVEELEASVSASDKELAQMNCAVNLYTIETAAMTDAERESIDTMLEAAEARKENSDSYYEEIDAIAQTAQGYSDYANGVKSNLETVMQEVQEMQGKYQESYLTAYDNIQRQIGLFQEVEVGTSESIDRMIGNMDSQVEYMNEYAENIKKAMELGIDEGILQQLSDGSTESAAILEEIVGSGQDKIDELNEQFARVSEGKEAFSTAVAEMETYYGVELDIMVQDLADAVAGMAMYDAAYESAQQTCNGILAGLESKKIEVLQAYEELSKGSLRAYNKSIEINSPSKKFEWSAEMTMEGLEKGVEKKEQSVRNKYSAVAEESIKSYEKRMEELQGQSRYLNTASRVPVVIRENYLKETYRETVGTGKTVPMQIFNITTPVKSPSELMRAARLEQQYGLAGE